MKTLTSRFKLGLAAATLAAGAMFSSTPAISQDSAWAGSDANARAVLDLYEAAKTANQTEVVVYGGYSAIYKPIWEVFAERFPGIAVVPNPSSGAALVSKLDAEFASGQHGGDVLMAGMTELLSTVAQERTDSFLPPNLAGLPERYVDPQGKFVIQFADVFGLVYNTTKMTEADLPATAKDLLDPKYKGLILDNPLAGGASALCWIELYNSDLLDPATMRGIRDNATIVPSLTPYYANLTTGSVKMLSWGSFARYLKLKASGAPLDFRAVPGLVVPLYGGTAILKGAPNSAAAQLFQAWFVTPEAQQALITRGSSYPLLTGVETPADWPKLQPLVDALKTIAPADYMAVRGKFEAAVREALQ